MHRHRSAQQLFAVFGEAHLRERCQCVLTRHSLLLLLLWPLWMLLWAVRAGMNQAMRVILVVLHFFREVRVTKEAHLREGRGRILLKAC